MEETTYDTYLSVSEVMKVLKLSRPTVIELINKGKLQGGRFGDHFKVPEKGLKEYIKNCMGVR